jgi:SAM-dependent methyltransferase
VYNTVGTRLNGHLSQHFSRFDRAQVYLRSYTSYIYATYALEYTPRTTLLISHHPPTAGQRYVNTCPGLNPLYLMSTADYFEKPSGYFTGARHSFVDQLPVNPTAQLLEIGCGNGDTAAYAKRTQKCGFNVGVELCAGPARSASLQLDQVLIGDVELVDLPFSEMQFDILVLSEVVEHLRDPWAALHKLHRFLKPGAMVLSGSPNVSHHSVIRMLFRGNWDYTSVGIMDRTHLRWFTPKSYRTLFEECGYTVHNIGPAAPLHTKARIFNALTLGRVQHLLHSQIQLFAQRR